MISYTVINNFHYDKYANHYTSVDKPNMVTYRLAFTRTLRERVCVPHCISMWHHGTPQDNIV